jgi:hypothetical protein
MSKICNKKFSFVKTFDENEKTKEKNTFYQLCQFKDPITKKYKTRKIIFDENFNILKMFEREYSYDELNIFIKHHRQNKFKMYPSTDINCIELPEITDIMSSKSELLNNNSKHYDFQKF